MNQAPVKRKIFYRWDLISPCKSVVEEVPEPEIYIMPVGVSSLFVLKTMSLVRLKHEFKFLAEVYEFVDQLHAILQVNVIIHDPVRKVMFVVKPGADGGSCGGDAGRRLEDVGFGIQISLFISNFLLTFFLCQPRSAQT